MNRFSGHHNLHTLMKREHKCVLDKLINANIFTPFQVTEIEVVVVAENSYTNTCIMAICSYFYLIRMIRHICKTSNLLSNTM